MTTGYFFNKDDMDSIKLHAKLYGRTGNPELEKLIDTDVFTYFDKAGFSVDTLGGYVVIVKKAGA